MYMLIYGISCIFKPHTKSRALNLRKHYLCLLYTSDAADERSSVDLGGRRIIKKKKSVYIGGVVGTKGTDSSNKNVEHSDRRRI